MGCLICEESREKGWRFCEACDSLVRPCCIEAEPARCGDCLGGDDYDGPRGGEAAAELADSQHAAQVLK